MFIRFQILILLYQFECHNQQHIINLLLVQKYVYNSHTTWIKCYRVLVLAYPAQVSKALFTKNSANIATPIRTRHFLYSPLSGTPLHQPEEDQQIHPNALQQQQQVPPLAPMGSLTPTLGLGMGLSMMPQIKHSYVPGFSTPQSMMQSQTPVSNFSLFHSLYIYLKSIWNIPCSMCINVCNFIYIYNTCELGITQKQSPLKTTSKRIQDHKSEMPRKKNLNKTIEKLLKTNDI